MACVQAPASCALSHHLLQRQCRSSADAAHRQVHPTIASRKPLHNLFSRAASQHRQLSNLGRRQWSSRSFHAATRRALSATRVYFQQETPYLRIGRQGRCNLGRCSKRRNDGGVKSAALSLTETTLLEEPLPESDVEFSEAAMQANEMAPNKTPLAEPAKSESKRSAEDPKAEKWVPRRLGEAAVHFLKQPSVLLSLAAILAVAGVRSRFRWTVADGPVVVIMAAWWAFFEWFLHAKLLHSQVNWFGRGIHKRHHEAPFHHVSIDGTDLVAVSLVGFAGFCFALFGRSPLALTGTLTVYCMGLLYEWTHYLVHTKVPMRSYIGSLIKRAHVSHHLKDQRYWLSFTCPAIDVIMGTTPQGGQGVTPVT